MEMMEAHQELEARFQDHQVALLDRDGRRAHRSLLAFRSLLLHHMEEEERFVLPLFEKLCGNPPGGRRELFEAEHAKIRQNLDRLVEKVYGLAGVPPERITPGHVLDLLDRAWPFKELMRHHELREQNLLYPSLDRAIGEAARRDFWQSIADLRLERQRWAGVMSSEGHLEA